ncbi:ATPase involved in chromosome partitioning [Sphaerochaeta pleomorpha str. Grapes]|uniref:ATPase involved in chromosome partitioning n=1 Tax=Sphaerochaeta pleomorpha (strain ATCC BAA-1885 / DSM 22778 / Grapes) TaxID=158190 RepID=G8QS25_SPHPG|nr:AAA family ATPase [Sphaerochaeta pleomorpha]AEV30023.1 ATPase involved in chromosome partitioning [Sphaerochaeta pleomorpha str. Grapes]
MAEEMALKQEEFRLPLELKTVLKTLRQKWVWILIICILALPVGAISALLLGTQKYEATTVLFYQPIESYVPDTFKIYQSVGEGTELSYEQGAGLVKQDASDTSLWNKVNMVKTLPNLEELRRELSVAKTLDQLGSSISVDVARDTNLMFISATSEDPEQAKLLANTIRDIFLSNNNSMISNEIQDRLVTLKMQFASATNELATAKSEFKKFIELHNIRDIATESPKYASELVDLELSLEKNKQQVEIYRQRVEKIQEAIKTANMSDIEEQKRQTEAKSVGLTSDEANNKIQQISQKIDEIKANSTNPIEEERLQTLYEIAENDYVRGLITRSEYETAKYNYESFMASHQYSAEIETLKAETEKVRSMTIVGGGDSVASSEYLKLVRVMLLDNQLELIKLEMQYEVDQKRYDFLSKNYINLPELNQNYIVLTGRVASLEAETRGLEKVLTQFKIVAEKDHSDFYVISNAEVPLLPQDSNRKLIAVVAAFMVFLIGFSALLILVITDQRIKSAGDAKQKLQKPVIAVFPFEKHTELLLPDKTKESEHIERYRILARPLRLKYPKSGATFLITSTADGEGKSTLAINLAMVFGRQDEHVLVIDAQIRKTDYESPFKPYNLNLGSDSVEKKAGLGEYLSFKVADSADLITQTSLSGVDMIIREGEAVVPDLLQSSRMRELMEELKQQYSIIIIEGPPVGDTVDSEILANYADAILYVTACDMLKPNQITQSLSRLGSTRIPLEGIVLTKVMPVYVD